MSELMVSEQRAVSPFMPVMSMDQAIERRNVIVQATQSLMREGVDYGTIPNSGDKPCLLQPGADKLCNLFGLTIQYEFLVKVEDWTGHEHGGEPFFYYQLRGRAYRGDYLMGEGIGSCSSWESKYRYRKAERTCPVCGVAAIIKGREEFGGGYVCYGKKGGCGAKFRDGDKEIEGQTVGRIPNSDIADQVNTIVKMAVKRTKLAATINATSASEFFTQDIEDYPPMDAPNGHAAQSGSAPEPPPPPPAGENRALLDSIDPDKPWATKGQMTATFAKLKAVFAHRGVDLEYARILDDHGAKTPEDLFRSKEDAIGCFQKMWKYLHTPNLRNGRSFPPAGPDEGDGLQDMGRIS